MAEENICIIKKSSYVSTRVRPREVISNKIMTKDDWYSISF